MLYFRPALVLFILLSILTGIIYPLLIAGIGKVAFPHQVAGSLISDNHGIVGSSLIGQNFTSTQYFWGRPSVTSDFPYNAQASKGSNLGPLNPELIKEVNTRVRALKIYNPKKIDLVPVDLATASASGLDPDISPAAAFYQIDRVANARKVPLEKIRQLVENHTQNRQFGFLGEPRVNVLQINLTLDQLYPTGVTNERTTSQSR